MQAFVTVPDTLSRLPFAPLSYLSVALNAARAWGSRGGCPFSSLAPVCRPASKLLCTQSEPLTDTFVGLCQANFPVSATTCPRSHPPCPALQCGLSCILISKAPLTEPPTGGILSLWGPQRLGPQHQIDPLTPTHSEEGRELV